MLHKKNKIKKKHQEKSHLFRRTHGRYKSYLDIIDAVSVSCLVPELLYLMLVCFFEHVSLRLKLAHHLFSQIPGGILMELKTCPLNSIDISQIKRGIEQIVTTRGQKNL